MVARFAFYGSLRRGMPLYQRFRSKMTYKFSLWLQRYALYSLGAYPIAVKTDHREEKILIEIFEITDKATADEIFKIEYDAGYYSIDIEVEGLAATLFLFKENANNPPVKSGDWVEFFRS